MLNRQTVYDIFTLWRHAVPPKIIARALELEYATISLYIRSFKVTHEQLPSGQIVDFILKRQMDTDTSIDIDTDTDIGTDKDY